MILLSGIFYAKSKPELYHNQVTFLRLQLPICLYSLEIFVVAVLIIVGHISFIFTVLICWIFHSQCLSTRCVGHASSMHKQVSRDFLLHIQSEPFLTYVMLLGEDDCPLPYYSLLLSRFQGMEVVNIGGFFGCHCFTIFFAASYHFF